MTLLTATGLRTREGLRVREGLKTRTGLLVGGESTVPAWVEALRAPSGDLPLIASWWAGTGATVGGVHWRSDQGIVTCQELWEQDPDLYWGHFDPALDVVPGLGIGGTLTPRDGATSPDNGEPILIPTLNALFPTGYTWLIRWLATPLPDPDTDQVQFYTGMEYGDYPGFNTDFYTSIHQFYGTLVPPPDIDNINASNSNHFFTPTLTLGKQAVATTFGTTFAGVSRNGQAVIDAGTPNIPSTPNRIMLQAGNWGGDTEFYKATQRLFSPVWALYAPQALADLPAMATTSF